MGQNFLPCDREQDLLLPPSLRDWLGEDHVVWFVLDAVETMDLSEFYAAYRADGHGRAAHDPGMMVALLLYSYACGERSARVIERRCREDVPTRVVCANRVPDHTTIARFRVRHEAALSRMFTQILGLCARAGLVSVGVVALDGTAISADASREATRSHESIRREVERMLGEAAEVDAREDALYGEARGDELPAELIDRRSRLERLRRCREELESEQAKAQAAYQENLRWRAEWEAEHGRKLGGRKPFPPDPDGLGKRTINVTNPDSRVIARETRQPVQGYNAQAVATSEQIIVAADITQQSNDSGQLIWRVVCQVGVCGRARLGGRRPGCSGGRGVGRVDGVASLICGDCHPRALCAAGVRGSRDERHSTEVVWLIAAARVPGRSARPGAPAS
jgi:transposase